MMIPIGRRRLVLALVAAPAPRVPEPAAALGASDAELVRLAGGPRLDVDRARWEGTRLLFGGRR